MLLSIKADVLNKLHIRKSPLVVTLLSILLGFIQVFGVLEYGSSLQEMKQELGEPSAKIKRGSTTVYSYPQGVVHVENGIVVKISEGFYSSNSTMERSTAEGSVEIEVGGQSTASQIGDRVIGGVQSVAEEAKEMVATDYSGEWLHHLRQAKEIAKKLKRDVLVVFTKSDTSESCMQLDRRILQSDLFRDFAREKLVLVKIDFPKGYQLQSSTADYNESMAKKWTVLDYPTVILMNPNEQELGRLGYATETPEDFIGKLSDLLTPQNTETGSKAAVEETQPKEEKEYIKGIPNKQLLLYLQIFAAVILGGLLARKFMRR